MAAIVGTSGRVPMRFDAPVTATRRVRSESTAVDRIRRELAGLGVEVGPAHGRAGTLGGLHPRPHVRVVVEPGDDDLVARAPLARQVPREVVDELRGAAPVHDAARMRVEQVGHREPEPVHGRLGALL